MSCFTQIILLKGTYNVMVGIKDDVMILSPLEEAIKGQTEINKNLIRVSEILSI